MATAAPVDNPTDKPAPSAAPAVQPKTGGGYSVARPHGQCAACGQMIAPGAKFLATLRETPDAFERVDCCLSCGDAFRADNATSASVVGFWRATMPPPEARKKLFVDNEVLCTLFERLADAAEEAKIHFRFVLGLILMRKRLIAYEGSRTDAGQSVWSVRFRGRDERMDLIDPHLNEQQVQTVSQQMGQILHEEL